MSTLHTKGGSLRVVRAACIASAISLVLGLVTSFSVTWTWGLNQRVQVTRDEQSWTTPAGDRWGLVYWGGGKREATNITVTRRSGKGEPPPQELLELLPFEPWRAMVRDAAAKTTKACFWNTQAYGWPRIMVVSGFAKPDMTGSVQYGEFSTGIKNVGFNGDLPVGIVWSGLLVNTLVLGAAWAPLVFLTLYAGGMIRTFRRRRRGLCLHCGYDLRHRLDEGCPECGWNCAPALAPEAAKNPA